MEPAELTLRQRFPWLRLLGGVGLALDGRKMLLAVLGIVLTWAGWQGLDAVFAETAGTVTPPVGEVVVRLRQTLGLAGDGGGLPLRRVPVVAADPIRIPGYAVPALLGLGGGTGRFAHALAATVWAVLIWGVVGAAIARIAVVQIATGERIGLLKGLRFAIGKVRPLVFAPLGALAGIAFFAAFCAAFGLLYRIPGEVAATVAAARTGFPMLAGLVMVMILVGLAAGWPLMVATVAAEGEDTFDALSRSYSYVYQRPGSYAFQVAVAWIVGAVGLVLVGFLARLVVVLTARGLAFGAPDPRIAEALGSIAGQPATTAGAIHAGWLGFVGLLAYGWTYAYAWSAAAQIYLLLRHDLDGAPFDDIDWPGDSPTEAAAGAPRAADGPPGAPGAVEPTTASGPTADPAG